MNDVARCLARDNAGSVEAFAEKMNARAAQLGMTQLALRQSQRPAGARPIFHGARHGACRAWPPIGTATIRSIVRERAHLALQRRPRRTLSRTPIACSRISPLCNGMKTGYTDAAGLCLISSASYGGRDVIAVVLGDEAKRSGRIRYRLLAWGLSS